MPSYDYLCRECGNLFEVRATIAEKTAGLSPECPACHAKDTNQIITTGALLHTSPRDSGLGCCGPKPRSGTGCCGG